MSGDQRPKDSAEGSSRSGGDHYQPQPAPLSRYESQKRRDWNTFGQYLKNQRPPVSLSQSNCNHVLDFLRYLDQFGKTKVHLHGCVFFGQPNPPAPCTCPLRQAWGSLDALIGRLRAAYEEHGGSAETNPFGNGAIRVYLREVKECQAKARGAHAKALMPSFGDGKEDQRTIEGLTQEITGLLRKSEKQLKRLAAAGPSEDSNVRKNVQRSLATDLQNLSMELRKKQSTYLKRLRQQNEGQDGDDLEMNLNGGRSIIDDDNLDDMVFNEHQMAKLKKSEAFTVEREREIQQVVESVNELAQIMKDLSVLVIDQGTIVDRIDYNIQNVATTVEEGLKQLQKAERTQKRGGMVMCATVLVIMCAVMLILLILKTILF